MQNINVLVVDDHKAVLSGTKLLLEHHGMNVTIAYNGNEALEKMQQHVFDVHLYDLKMPDMNGIELTKKTLELHPQAKIVIFSGEDILSNFNVLIAAGVSGIIDKAASANELMTGIQMAMQRMVVLPLDVVRQLSSNTSQADANESTQLEMPLNELEKSILEKAALGRTNKEIADEFNMVQRNVEYHLSHAYKKLNVTSRVSAIRKAAKMNIISVQLATNES